MHRFISLFLLLLIVSCTSKESHHKKGARFTPEMLSPDIRNSVCRQPGMVVLTFDDGPVLPNFEILLDFLDKAKVTATFFQVAQKLENPELAAFAVKAYQKGHTIGNHTYTHEGLDHGDKAALKQLTRANEKFKEVLGKEPIYMRPPFGILPHKDPEKLFGSLGLEGVLWNFDSKDWHPDNDTQAIIKGVQDLVDHTNPLTDSFIILQHDVHLKSVYAVPAIIEILRKANYRIVSLPDCLGTTKSGTIVPARDKK